MKKNIFLTLILNIALFHCIIGQELQQAPVNDEFEKFIQSKSNIEGIIPSPNTYVFSDQIKMNLAKIDFPDSYDLRNESLVTSVKNQGDAGHCWSFAAIGSIESRNLKLGFQGYNLSEQNLATCHGFLWDEGGNQSIATAYFSRLSGPILEVHDPYNDTIFSCSETNQTPSFYVPESRFLPRNPDLIKYYLMNYGAIAVSYMHDNNNYNPQNNTYYYDGNDASNHGVVLVGWDDNKTTDGGTGAWIIKNSWGKFWGDNGYFYMSYNDTYALSAATIYPIRKETHNIDTLFMYDELGEVSSYGYGDMEDYALIKYSVSKEYNFNKVGTFIGAMNSVVDIEVFGTKNENVLTDTLAKKYDVFCDYPGYHTFDIPFTAIGDFYIKIKYQTPNDNYPIPVETFVSSYASPNIKSNVGWISNDGKSWNSIGKGTNTEVDLCIRAYGIQSDIKASLTSNYHTTCKNTDLTLTSTSSGDITNYFWDFGKDATPATASSEGPHTISYASVGLKTIKLVIENSEGLKDSIIHYDYIKVDTKPGINTSPGDSVYMNDGDTLELNAFGAETYIWSPANLILDDNTNSSVHVSPDVDTYYYVDATLDACSGKDSVKVIITYPPENDDVCDALELALNEELGPFSNANATVELNEPMPDTTGQNCNTQGYWCNESGLQHSVWFKFSAPGSGMVSIETDGFDNQIAVYEAENCADIVNGNQGLYEIIAANDDWEDEDYSATIDKISGLTEGKTYWLQMDGSAGGDEGECTITITEKWPSSTNSLTAQKLVKVYPNPSSGEFKLDISGIIELDSKSTIDILSIDGTLVKKIDYEHEKFEYNISLERPGMFLLKVNTKSNHYTVPIIIK